MDRDVAFGEPRNLWLQGSAGRIEAVLRVACPATAAALLAHPHPLHGGTLHNPVIFHADRELHRAGLTTMRFNFRGVGSSEGRHDEGRGEVDDVASSSSWLRGIAPGLPLLLVGFSFGAWCSIRHAIRGDGVAGVVAIGLAVRRYPFTEVQQLARPIAVVQGSEDEFGTPEEVRPLLESANPEGRLYVVDGASHLFPGQVREAATRVVEAARFVLQQ